jgi:hypothetical protein
MRSRAFLVLLAISLSAGCLVSEQVGERTHVNSPAPEEISFHFDSSFNKTLVFGRSAALLAVALWAFSLRKGPSGMVAIILAAALAVTSVSLLWLGWTKKHDYRIDVRRDHLHLMIPGESELRLDWSEIEEINVEGMALNVEMGGPEMEWAPQERRQGPRRRPEAAERRAAGHILACHPEQGPAQRRGPCHAGERALARPAHTENLIRTPNAALSMPRTSSRPDRQ